MVTPPMHCAPYPRLGIRSPKMGASVLPLAFVRREAVDELEDAEDGR